MAEQIRRRFSAGEVVSAAVFQASETKLLCQCGKGEE
jgi:hypothetical protein